MGLQFKNIVVKEEISISDLKGKILAVDTMNMLYQFLTTIRSIDGSVLTDSQGNVTSHLIGLFNRITSLMEAGIKLVFVFDGKPPEIKNKTIELRKAAKKQASLKLKEAEEADDYASMRKFAARTVSLTPKMIENAKNVISALGLPIVQAPSEGEAQTAFMVKQGDAYASISQDYDNLIFDCPRLVRNLTIAGRRKKNGTAAMQTVKPELLEVEKVLQHLNLSLNQLRVLAILAGTDYNPGGIKGIGPKKALKLLTTHGEDFPTIFKEAKWDEHYPETPWETILKTIQEIPTTSDYKLEWNLFDRDELIDLLVKKHEFSEDRVLTKLDKIEKKKEELSQTGLGRFF